MSRSLCLDNALLNIVYIVYLFSIPDVNHSDADTAVPRDNLVNTVDANVVSPFVAMPSAIIILTKQYQSVLKTSVFIRQSYWNHCGMDSIDYEAPMFTS